VLLRKQQQENKNEGPSGVKSVSNKDFLADLRIPTFVQKDGVRRSAAELLQNIRGMRVVEK
jgi:hypothetical protein